MKNSTIQLIGMTLVVAICFVVSQPANAVSAAQASPQTQESTPAEGLEFNWDGAPWPDVVEWFADQADLILEKVDQYPEGTFSLVSERPLSPIEAIDEINHRLRLSNPPKMLLRNGRRLFLVDADAVLPSELVETVAPFELDQRGKYEPLQTMFDVSGLDLNEIENQVGKRVQEHNKKSMQLYRDTNELFVRESGENLRFIRNIIERAKASKTSSYSDLYLKHISAELFIDQIRMIHELDENNRNEDRTLFLIIDAAPGSQRIVIRGTAEKIRDVEKAAAIFDVPAAKVEASADDPITLEQYTVPRDSKEAFEVIDRLLFDLGGGARVIQGSETGKITVLGREADHATVRDYLGLAESGNGGFETVQLVNGKAGDIALDTQTILGITVENADDNVKLLPNDSRDWIMVRGTPAQVTDAVEIIKELDQKSAPVSNGIRTKRRVISMPAADRDRVLEALQDYLPTLGRDNPFEVRPARAPEKDDDSLFRQRDKKMKNNDHGSIFRSRLFEVAAVVAPGVTLQFANSMLQSPDDPSPGDAKNPGDYKLPDQIKSVPGAPVRIWGTESGIIIETLDLDAGDDVEYLVDDLLGDVSDEIKPQIYRLVHCEAGYMKTQLEKFFGLESSSGGGGGSSLLGGIAGSVMGEAGGGMVDSLFGGGLGGDTDSPAAALEGDVTIGIDGRLNYMWVIGATSNDIELIDAVVEEFDVSSPPQSPETAGQIYSIQIQHRDVEEIKTQVETLMEKYFSDDEAKQGGGGGNEAANMMKMMRSLTGGGGGGGGNEEEVRVRGYLSVDKMTSKLLFLGPKSIFIQVETLVANLDQPQVEVPRSMLTIPLDGEDGQRYAEMLRDLLGDDKIEISGGGLEGEAEDGSGTKGMGKAAESAEATQAKQQAEQRNQLQQLFRNAAQRGQNARGNQNNRRGNQNRGNQNRGNQNRRGGGR